MKGAKTSYCYMNNYSTSYDYSCFQQCIPDFKLIDYVNSLTRRILKYILASNVYSTITIISMKYVNNYYYFFSKKKWLITKWRKHLEALKFPIFIIFLFSNFIIINFCISNKYFTYLKKLYHHSNKFKKGDTLKKK